MKKNRGNEIFRIETQKIPPIIIFFSISIVLFIIIAVLDIIYYISNVGFRISYYLLVPKLLLVILLLWVCFFPFFIYKYILISNIIDLKISRETCSSQFGSDRVWIISAYAKDQNTYKTQQRKKKEIQKAQKSILEYI